MSERIVIQPVTRIEGHAKISIYLDDTGAVSSAQFHVTEFRGFEKLCEGSPFHEMPGLMSRICGICPVSHVLASSKAGDMLLGVAAPPAAVLQRRLVNYAQLLQSHALSFLHLSAPDLCWAWTRLPKTATFSALPGAILNSRGAASGCASSASGSSRSPAANESTPPGACRAV